jgi:serine/threonine-protein kinase
MAEGQRAKPDLIASALERDEHAGRVARTRAAACVALVAWPAFALVDWFLVAFVHPGRLSVYLAARGLGLLCIGLGALRLSSGRRPPGPRGLRALDATVFAAMGALIALTAGECGGLESPLVLGTCTLLVARAALLGDHFRYSLLPVGLAVAAYPAMLGLLALWSPGVAAQFRSPPAVAKLALAMLFVMGSAALSLVGGHVIWTLRRQLFETRSLGRYRLQRRIGKGGMGEVWIAHHVALGRDVAVKFLHPDQQRDPQATERFSREVRATARLSHPNTVRVFDFGVTKDGLCYYAMELLDGVDLASLVRRTGPLPPRRGLDLVLQASRALAEAHEHGIVHRDVKPGNVFVARVAGDRRDFVKVLDFGLARFDAGEGLAPITGDGFAVGTPSYVSPEVLRGGTADARSDVYALGGLLHFVLTGAPPFPSPETREVLRAHLRQPPPALSDGTRWPLPPGLEALVARCLRKDPAERFANAGALVAALEGVVGPEPSAEDPASGASAAANGASPDSSPTVEVRRPTAAVPAPRRVEDDTIPRLPRTPPRPRR